MKKTLLATAIILALAATPTVFAKGKPPPHEETGNNLSFATKFVPSTTGAPTLRLPCLPTATPPDAADPKCMAFPGYWCQKTAADWQAACTTGSGADVAAAWGANLLGDAPLKAGRPIRVEMVLTEVAGDDGVGYDVKNLTPELEDRLATYGTNGSTITTDYVIYDAGATLKIEKCGEAACTSTVVPAIFYGEMSPEINSVGRVVYGYNWGTAGKTTAATSGFYKLTFTSLNTVILTAGGAQVCGPDCTFVVIEVTQSAGGGGSGRK